MAKALHPAGTKVRFEYLWYGRVHARNGHECTVVSSKIVKKNKRNYYKYELKDLVDGKVFKAEDMPPTSRVIPI